jgi:hypothetical protein
LQLTPEDAMTQARTELTLANASSEPVQVSMTLGTVKRCVSHVANIPFITTVLSDLQGWFMLPAGQQVSYTPPPGFGLNGNVSFGSPPMNCATADYPSGINLAEFMLNNAFQGAAAQETLDISCVAGANAFVQISVEGGDGWNAGPTQPSVTQFQNQAIGGNVGQVGVYPYACDVCTGSQNPPQCDCPPAGAPQPPVPQTEAICNVQRNAAGAGGTVTVTFAGFIPA